MSRSTALALRLLLGVVLVAAFGHGLVRHPASAAEVPPVPGFVPMSPLPSIELPLPSISLPLPSIGLASPLPSIALPTPSVSLPVPSVSLPAPTVSPVLPSLSPTRSPGASAGASRAADRSSAPQPNATSDPSSAAPDRNPDHVAGRAAGTASDTPGRSPALAEVGGPSTGRSGGAVQPEWLVPVLAFGVPALLVAAAVLAQVVGGATIVGVARRKLSRLPGPMPRWMREATDAQDGGGG